MRRTAVALVLAVLALAPACGRKSRPLPPEEVQPEAPGDLTAIAVPEGVRLSFTRPTHYTGGGRMNDLGKLVVERAPGEGAAPKFEKVGEVVLEDRDRFRQERRLSWVDATATPGARYLYRVTAITIDRYKSQPAGPVAVRFGPAEEAPARTAPTPEKEPAP
jgi:hypothetical protein